MNVLHKLKMKLKKPKEVEKLEINVDKCVGCGNCVKMCKREVFTMQRATAVIGNFSACVGCGKCMKKMCNFGAINLVLAKTS